MAGNACDGRRTGGAGPGAEGSSNPLAGTGSFAGSDKEAAGLLATFTAGSAGLGTGLVGRALPISGSFVCVAYSRRRLDRGWLRR